MNENYLPCAVKGILPKAALSFTRPTNIGVVDAGLIAIVACACSLDVAIFVVTNDKMAAVVYPANFCFEIISLHPSPAWENNALRRYSCSSCRVIR